MSLHVVLALTLTLAPLGPAPRRATAADATAPGPAGPTDFDFLEGRWTAYDSSADALQRLAFLAGDWQIQDSAGEAHYRWHPGTLWLGYEVVTTLPGAGPYEVAGGVSFDSGSGEYVAYAVNNLAPRLAEYRGRWTDETTLVFDGVGMRGGKKQRVQYARASDGRVVFSASESDDGGPYRTQFEAVLVPTHAARLGALATAIQAADYEADRAELSRLAEALTEVTDPRLQADCSYWSGFARWRRALNGFNQTPAPEDLAADLEEAVRRFRSALAGRPEWIEARIGIAGAQSNLLFLARDDAEATRRILAEYVPVMREVAVQGGENPRALWLMGGIALGAPPPHGGDAAKAAATFALGLEAARREARESVRLPAHAPSWGAAENLMSLAYLHSRGALQDPERALAYARGALAIVPRWHYVSDVLLPQIEALGVRGTAADARGQAEVR